ncbi:MAG TPA: Uma2 family endonuclease [Polyangiales bacterium]|nr:Uma2 family endonuclease [Polyangiales bacterium]
MAIKLATYADLVALPDDVRAEVVAGRLVVSPPPMPEHGRAQRTLGSFVGGPYDDDDGRGGPGGWWLMAEVDVQLSVHDVVRPDVSGWRRERLPKPQRERPISLAPDWICEVISPSNAKHDLVTKRELYARFGVPYYWLIEPERRVLTALTLRDGLWLELGVYDDSAKVRIEPFPAVELEVGRLFFPKDAE